MILTLTCNLLAERTLNVPAWAPGRTHRATAESFQVGGKGINVARMLARIHSPHTALCFIGGASGAECAAWLRHRKLSFHGFSTSVPTRSGTVIRDSSQAQRETTFLGPDAAPDAAAILDCAAFLDARPAGEVLALCGSIPGWAEPRFDPLRAAFKRWQTRGPLVADTYGPPLAWFATQPVALIKINADELRSLAAAASDAFPSAPRNWVVSDGARSLRFRDATGATGTLTPPVITEVSPTGSGDVLLACLLHGLFVRRLQLREALEFSIPFAAANAAHPGIAEFPPLPGETLVSGRDVIP